MENPSFFAVLPAAVRYDARLSASEKIFFAEITALTEAEGYCYAANAYFSDLYGVDERTVRRWLGHLQTAGYIEVEPAAGGEAPHPRRIWLAGRTVRGAEVDAAADEAGKNVRGAGKNVREGRAKMSGPTSQEQKNNNNTGARASSEPAASPSRTVGEIFAEFCAQYNLDQRLDDALGEFASSRAAKKKPLTPWAAELLCKKLRRLAAEAEARDPVDYMVQALEESVVNSWSGVFALKEYRPTPPAPKRQQDSADKPRMIGADADISALF